MDGYNKNYNNFYNKDSCINKAATQIRLAKSRIVSSIKSKYLFNNRA